jgi:site-specific DNA-adenine methylase
MGSTAGYFGGKSGAGVYQAIIAQMPPHDVFIDAFAGGGSILFRKPRARRTIAIDRDPAVLALLRGKDWAVADEFRCGDARSLIAGFDYAAGDRVLIYCDPPYVQATRGEKRYRFDFTDQDHAELVAVLRSVPAAVMVSGYPSALYDRLLPDWRSFQFQTMTRGGVRTEKVWCNFPAGAVHWASFAGRNFTHRQQIKRKAARWAAKYAKLPPAERTAVLAALLAIDPAA